MRGSINLRRNIMNFSTPANKISYVFASAGTFNNIPATVSGVTLPNQASYQTGFPTITLTPLVSGGLPPLGADMNGILNALSQAANWSSAGGLYSYDSTFATTVGGYPKGALLAKYNGVGLWQNIADANTTNPDSGGTNWVDPIINATINPTTDPTFVNSSTSPSSTSWVVGSSSVTSHTIKLPKWLGGLIFQWGSISAGDDTYTAITFPTPYTVLYYATATPIYNDAITGPNNVSAWVGNLTTTGMSIGLGIINASGISLNGAYWFSIGI